MAAIAEVPFLSKQAKKEEENKKREARIRALEEEKRRKKEEEKRQKREKELQAIANFRNNGHNNKQVPRIPPAPVALPKQLYLLFLMLQRQIPVKSTGINYAPNANILFGRKETQAPAVETQATNVVGKTQSTTVVMNYASALQNEASEGHKNLGTYNAVVATSVSVTTSVTTTFLVVPQTNQAAKVVVPQTNQAAKAVVVPHTN
ncbi:hypothetical protein ACLB2K_037903 [Fragaria x ananassa]